MWFAAGCESHTQIPTYKTSRPAALATLWRSAVSRSAWRVAVAMLFAIAGLVAAFVAIYLYVGLLYSVLVFLGLALAYALVFETKWCYIALQTAPRDIK